MPLDSAQFQVVLPRVLFGLILVLLQLSMCGIYLAQVDDQASEPNNTVIFGS
jgi:hypothetical protein